MRNCLRRSPVLALAAGLLTLVSFAPRQAAAQAVKITIEGASVEEQKTPDYSVKGVTDKKWNAKSWLEFEVLFKTQIAQTDAKTISGLTAKFYLFFDAASREESKVYTGESKLVSVAEGKSACVAYVSPASLAEITGSETGGKNKIEKWGVEFLFGGVSVGMKSSDGKPWWKNPKAPPSESGTLLKKSETPFAPLWGDYHAAESKN